MITQLDEWISWFINYNALFVFGFVVMILVCVSVPLKILKPYYMYINVFCLATLGLFFANLYYSTVTVQHICSSLFSNRDDCEINHENVKFNDDGKLEIMVFRENPKTDVYLVGKKEYDQKKMIKREKITLVFKNTWSEDGLTQLIYRTPEIKKMIAKYHSYDKEFDDSRRISSPEKKITSK